MKDSGVGRMSKAPKKGDKTKALYALHWLPGLSKGAACLGSWLVWHANAKTGLCTPGQARLIRETGLSERSIRLAKRELQDRRIISLRQVDQESTSFTVHWQTLSDATDEFETLANSGKVVVQPRSVRGPKKKSGVSKGGQNIADKGAENCRKEGQYTAPKPVEANPLNETAYSVGPHSDKSEPGDLKASPSAQDGLMKKMLETKEDFNFVKLFQRVIVDGGKRLPRTDASEMVCARLEQAAEGSEGAEGRDYRSQSRRYFEAFDDFLEPEYEKSESANG